MSSRNPPSHWGLASQWLSAACVTLLAGGTGSTQASNPEYQAFFSLACSSAPSGSLLEDVCFASATNISADSESSLNPSQPLASADASLQRAREKAQDLSGTEVATLPVTPKAAIRVGPLSLLLNTRATSTDRELGDGERGYEADQWSLEVGADQRLSNRAVVGAFMAYQHSNLDFDQDLATSFAAPPNAGGIDQDQLSFTLFGAYSATDSLYIDASAGFGISEIDFTRNAVAQDSGGTFTVPVQTEASADGTDYWASAGLGWGATYRHATRLGVYGRATYARAEVDGYTEADISGTGFNLAVGKAQHRSLTTTLGLSASHTFGMSWGVVVPQVRAEYEREFEDDPVAVQSAFVLVPDTGFSPAGEKPDLHYFTMAAGAQAIFPGGWLGFLELQSLLGHRDFDRTRIAAGLRVEL